MSRFVVNLYGLKPCGFSFFSCLWTLNYMSEGAGVVFAFVKAQIWCQTHASFIFNIVILSKQLVLDYNPYMEQGSKILHLVDKKLVEHVKNFSLQQKHIVTFISYGLVMGWLTEKCTIARVLACLCNVLPRLVIFIIACWGSFWKNLTTSYMWFWITNSNSLIHKKRSSINSWTFHILKE